MSVRQSIHHILQRTANYHQRLTSLFDPDRSTLTSSRKAELHRWYKDQRGRDLIVEHPNLNEDSVVWDIGGFEGHWAAAIYCRYGCRIEVFEPVESFQDSIVKRFGNNRHIRLHRFGLSNRDETTEFVVSGVRSSSHLDQPSSQKAQVLLKDIGDLLTGDSGPQVDLLKINIEGGEYAVLPRMIECGAISKCRRILIQFHDFVPNAEDQRRSIVQSLQQTHQEIYDYRYVWQLWQSKEDHTDSTPPSVS